MTLGIPSQLWTDQGWQPRNAGGGSGGSGNYVIVPDLAALVALIVPDGTLVFVETLRAFFVKQDGVIGTTTPGLVPFEVLASTDGTGVFSRDLQYSDLFWTTKISDIYIDPSNVTGIASDENRGIFSAPQIGAARRPLRSYRELYRRLGDFQELTSSDPAKTVTIHVLSDLNIFDIADQLELGMFAGIDVFPIIQGETQTVYVNRTLDAIGGFQAQNPAAPVPGGTDCQITVTGPVQVWAPFIGYEILFTATGAVATILKDLGGGTARISQPVLTNKAIDSEVPTPINPANGDAFHVILQTGISIGHIESQVAGTATSMNGFFKISDLNVSISGQDVLLSILNHVGGTYPLIEFYECKIDRPILANENVIWSGCQITQSVQDVHMHGGTDYWGCGMVTVSSRPHHFVSGKSSHAFNRGVLDFDTTVQGACVIAMGPTHLGQFSVWDAPVEPTNPLGHALLIGPSINERIVSAISVTSGTIFGAGSAGFGLKVNAGCRMTYEQLPNITGALGDFVLGDPIAGANVGWFFDIAAGSPTRATYQPAALPLACTWANMAAAQPAGFLGGNGADAHNPSQDAHVVPSGAS